MYRSVAITVPCETLYGCSIGDLSVFVSVCVCVCVCVCVLCSHALAAKLQGL